MLRFALLAACIGSAQAIVVGRSHRLPSSPRRSCVVASADGKVDGYLAKSAAALLAKENRISFAIGGFFIFGQLTSPVLVGLDRLGLIELPPLNALTSITNAAMDAEIASGGVPAIMGTMWAQRFYVDLISQYRAAPEGFLREYCNDAAHTAWCSAASVAAALQAGS